MGETPNIRTSGHDPEQANNSGYSTQIVHSVQPMAGTLAAPEETVEQRLARAEKQIAFRKGILKLIAANLEPTDITLYGEGDKETIHLTKSACKQILGWAGVTVQPDSNIQEKRYDGVEGPYIDFEVWATWLTPDGRYYRAMGNRSTYDDFFAKRTRYVCEECGSPIFDWKDSRPICSKDKKPVRYEKTTYYLPLSEVDIPAIKQAAITNLWNHIVEDAGLKPSKKELLVVGFKFDEVKDRVKFNDNKPEKSGQQQQAKPSPSAQQKDVQGAAAPAPPGATAAPSPKSGPPKADIPPGPKGTRAPAAKQHDNLPLGKGVISEAYLNKKKDGSPFVKVTQNGNVLSCFRNSTVETMDGDQEVFDLIMGAKGRFCEFTVETKGNYNNILGARRIGSYEWDESGAAVIRRDDPGAYEGTDEDISF